MGAVRELSFFALREMSEDCISQLRPINKNDFSVAIQRIRPSVSKSQLIAFEQWNQEFGMFSKS